MTITSYCIIRNQQVLTPSEKFSLTPSSFDDFLIALYDRLQANYPRFYKMDNQSKLGFLAAEILLKEYSIQSYKPETLSVVLSNANASLDTDIRFEASAQTAASPSLFVYTLANIVIGELCIRHGIKGENAFFVAPEFNARLMASYSHQVLTQNKTEVCLAGWVDVLGGQHNVFLYLVENWERGLALPHTATELEKLYRQ
jgi:hypothetical protein